MGSRGQDEFPTHRPHLPGDHQKATDNSQLNEKAYEEIVRVLDLLGGLRQAIRRDN